MSRELILQEFVQINFTSDLKSISGCRRIGAGAARKDEKANACTLNEILGHVVLQIVV